jgi:hypothetical protein
MDASRVTALEKMERRVRLVWWLLIPLVAVAAVDLVAGEPLDDRRVDVVVLVGAALQAWGHSSVARILRRRRRGIAPQRPNGWTYMRGFASSALSLGASSGVGYYLFGWAGAVAIVAATVLCVGLGVALGLWLRSRRRPPSRAGTPAAPR